jgi:cytidylate kinase
MPPDGVIAIDGPAGSGKSTTARAVAARLALLYVDTGAMYRALAWAALQQGIPTGEAAPLAELLRGATLELLPGKRTTTVVWNGKDITAAIRQPEVDASVSAVSSHRAVRQEMVERQRCLGRTRGVVMEGRDIGSVVFPLAQVKIFLDASLEARVERRVRQYRKSGLEMAQDRIRSELIRRDQQDSDRAESPLTIAPDAVVLDTSNWQLAEQIERVVETIHTCLQQRQRTVAEAARPTSFLTKYRVAYSAMTALARFYGLREVRLEGTETPQGCIIACNHVSWWDPPILGATLRRCRVRTIAKAELFRFPPFGALFRYLDTIPIQRSGYDSRAFNAAIASLKAGHNIFIFPEGTRRPICRPGPVRNGLGILVQKTQAAVQPVFVRGTCHLEPGGSDLSPLEVWYGPLVRMHALDHLQQNFDNRTINGMIAGLFEAIYWDLQARSFAENPPTDWELAESERQERKRRAKTERLFGRIHRRAPRPDATACGD